MQSILVTTSHTVQPPFLHLFYFPGRSFSLFASPLYDVARSHPSAIVLFSLSPEGRLIVSLLRESESGKRKLRRKLWSGSILRFSHPFDAQPFNHGEPIELDSPPSSNSSSPPLRTAISISYLDLLPDTNVIVLREPDATGTSASFRMLVESRIWEYEKAADESEEEEEAGKE